jgi:hypothetical protein
MHSGLDLQKYFVKHHSNHSRAKKELYTSVTSPQETRDEILAAT